MNEQKQLERLALKAHRNGLAFADWWPAIKPRVDAAEPYCLQRWRRLRDRLMHACVSGDESGQFAVGDDDALLNNCSAADGHLASLFAEVTHR